MKQILIFFALTLSCGAFAQTATVQQIPGKIEAENYLVAIGPKSEPTGDSLGGLDMGWIYQGDYLNYSVNVAIAGTYSVAFRISCPSAGASLMLKTVAGVVLATAVIPNTGGFQVWQTITAVVTLPAGAQILQVVSAAAPLWNINWMRFTLVAPPVITTGGGMVTPAQVVSEIDSFSHTLDSSVLKTVTAPRALSYAIDTLVLPNNSTGMFTLYYTALDSAGKDFGQGYQVIFVNQVNGVYSTPYVAYNSIWLSTGVAARAVSYSPILSAGLPVILVSGYGTGGSPIRWHLWKDSKISPL